MSLTRIAPAAAAALIVAGSLVAADWDRFRGPNGSGITTEKAPVSFVDNDLLWKTTIPGTGHSSPIIVGNRVYLQTSTKDQRSLLCVNADNGKVLWTSNMPGGAAKTHKKNSAASSTPVSDGERIYATFWDGEKVAAAAFDLAGKLLWTAELGAFKSQHGAGHSPMVVDGKVIVNFDQDGASRLLALDAKSGKEVWSTKREAYRACYSTPILRGKSEATELVVATTTSIDGIEPKNGQVKWTFPIRWKNGEMPLRAVAGPIMSDGAVIAATGDGGGSRYMIAIKPGENPTKLWDMSKDSPYVPCPIVHEGHVYWVNDGGVAVCADLKTGKVVWSDRLFAGRGAISSSPILVNGVVFAVAEDGKTGAFKATPKGLDKLPGSNVGEAVFATPAVSGGKLFIRGATQLFCYGPKAS